MVKPVLNVIERPKAGKNPLKQVRNEGYIPGILYGRHKESRNISMEKKQVDKLLKNYGVGARVVLNVDNQMQEAVIKNIGIHNVKLYVQHIDFQALDANEKVRIKVPVHLMNKSIVESNISVVQQLLTELEIQAYPKDLPQNVEIDCSNMKFGEPIKVQDLEVSRNENIQIMHEEDAIVALITTASKVEEIGPEESEEDRLRRLY